MLNRTHDKITHRDNLAGQGIRATDSRTAAHTSRLAVRLLAAVGCILAFGGGIRAEDLPRLQYNHPGLAVDLGVGLWAWPLPMDYDGDGDHDLVVVCPDAPYNGAYFFENRAGDVKLPVFEPAVRIDKAVKNVQLSVAGGVPRVLAPGVEYVDFRANQFGKPGKLPAAQGIEYGKVRANQWKYVDFDGDGKLDVVVGIGDWEEYGWDNAYDSDGRWTRGPLHGYVYWLKNIGEEGKPQYAAAKRIEAGGEPLDVFGMPSPNFGDFDGDGDLDLVCGEFLDRFSYFENTGSRTEPAYARPRFLQHSGQTIHMDLQMITPVAFDWDKDGDLDLISGDEDGRVALVENTGRQVDGAPQFLPPVYFQQRAADVKFGALVTPVSIDWDDDGDEDLICGNTAGYVGFIENLDGGNPPKWAAPVRLKADGATLRILAGPNGSIQGPCEAKWGYTTLSVADWDGDKKHDLVVNSIWGKVVWYRNVGSGKQPRLAAAEQIEVAWEGAPPKPAWNWWNPGPRELATQWRTTPAAVDFNSDGLCDLVMLDHEGYLALFERRRNKGRLELAPPRRLFYARGPSQYNARNDAGKTPADGPLRLNRDEAGRSGRRKFCLADWDGDGRVDLLVNSRSVNFLRNVADRDDGGAVFQDMGPVTPHRLAGHTTSPTTVDWNRDGAADLLIGAEDGFFYYLPNPH